MDLEKKSETIGHILYNSIYMKCVVEANPEVESRLEIVKG